jgi:hypothetical protein
MLKLVKKLLCVAVVGIITFSHVGISVYAGQLGASTERMITVEEQIADILNDKRLSQEEKDYYINRINSIINNDFADAPRLTRNSSAILNVPFFRQETASWCGPATAKQTVHFYNGFSDTQANIAKKVISPINNEAGLELIVDYVNGQISSHKYFIYQHGVPFDGRVVNLTRDYMRVLLVQAMSYTPLVRSISVQNPPILALKFSGGNGNWHYTTNSGHYLNASGFSDNGNLIQVTDPYITWMSPNYPSGKYWVSMDAIHAATMAGVAKRFAM